MADISMLDTVEADQNFTAEHHNDQNTAITNINNALSTVEGDISDLVAPSTVSYTRTGRTITQIDSGTKRWVISWTGNRISSIAYQDPAGSTVATYTPTYATSGRAITTWTKS